MKHHINKLPFGYNQAQLEGKIFIILASIGAVFSLITTVVNIVLKLNILTIFIAFGTSLFSFSLLYYSQKKKDFVLASYIGVFTLEFIVYPMLWITNGGSSGPTPYFLIFNTVLIIVLLYKKNIKPIIFSHFLVIITLIYLEGKLPNLILKYPSKQAHTLDLNISLILVSSFLLILLLLVMQEYNRKINELSNTQDKLRVLSNTDELSGVYNRRFVMNKLSEHVNGISNLSVIMFDIDNFKRINDQYGHTYGDEVIRVVSRTLKDNIRIDDTIGRIGGEEFLILLNDADNDSAKLRAESLRLSIADIKWSIPDLSITVSGGVYSKEHSDTIDVVLDKVDMHLYEAKRKGRNIIISAINECPI